MNLMLRTIIYSQKVTVHYVPVYTCANCTRKEVHPAVKQHLKEIVYRLGRNPEKQSIYFQDENEFAKFLYRASSDDFEQYSVDDMIHLRVNELLDMLILAESINDLGWVDEIHDRLDQLQDYTKVLHEWN
jgi:hypothetical protein